MLKLKLPIPGGEMKLWNAQVREWAEIDRLATLPLLEELLLLNNPVQSEFVGSDSKSMMAEYRIEVRAQ